MARRRLGVALLVPQPVATEVDGLRRACDDPALGTIGAHLTLVPPVNVRADDLADALGVLHAAAATCPPLALCLGPPVTFLPAEPVLYLAVAGAGGGRGGGGEGETSDPAVPRRVAVAPPGGAEAAVDDGEGPEPDPVLDRLHALREAVFRPPLARPLSHAFVPHVTLCAGGPAELIEAAARGLGAYEVRVEVGEVTLLEEVRDERGRRWVPLADAPLGGPAVVGRGGLPVELSVGRIVDPAAATLVPAHAADPCHDPAGPSAQEPLVVTARREGTVLGLAAGWTSGACGAVRLVAVSDAVAPGEQVGDHVRAAFESAAADRGVLRVEEHPAGP